MIERYNRSVRMCQIPEYKKLKELAEQKLSNRLNGDCYIRLLKGYDEETLSIIKRIDHKKFREELWYTNNEIKERMEKPGFLCFLVYYNGEPIAFEYGYDLAEGVYFSDSQATLIEGKGVGTTQFALEILYLFHNNYKKIKLTTEEVDDEGRELRIFWERMGFVKLGEDEKGSVDMEIELTLDAAQYQYERYIKPR